MLAVGVLSALLLCVHTTGHWQHVASTVLAQSAHQAFLATRGGEGEAGHLENFSGLGSSGSFLGDPLEQELLRAPGLIARLADASEYSRPGSPLLRVRSSVRRQTYVHAGSGHASSDLLAQQRVEASGLVWQRASLESRSLARYMAQSSGRVDKPWGRSNVGTDWLGKWTGLVPRHVVKGELK